MARMHGEAMPATAKIRRARKRSPGSTSAPAPMMAHPVLEPHHDHPYPCYVHRRYRPRRPAPCPGLARGGAMYRLPRHRRAACCRPVGSWPVARSHQAICVSRNGSGFHAYPAIVAVLE